MNCPTGKVVHLTRDRAKIARDKMCLKNTKKRSRMNVYRCEHCNLWHIGNSDNTNNLDARTATEVRTALSTGYAIKQLIKDHTERMKLLAGKLSSIGLNSQDIATMLGVTPGNVDDMIRQLNHQPGEPT